LEKIKITLPDSTVIEANQGETAYDIVGIIGKGLQEAALSVEIDGVPSDLSTKIDRDVKLTVITFKDDRGKEIFWHSTSHLMAQAIKRIFPEAKFAIGPAISNGFYYDIDVDKNFVPDDLIKIEEEMQKIVSEKLEIKREELSKSDAIEFFSKEGEIYKVEMLNEFEDETVSGYRQGEFFDLCRGPHLSNTSKVKSIKLLSIAGAYWRGDEKNKMLQRIYGISFPERKELKKHLNMLEEAKKRDHRKLGKDLDIFSFDKDVGAGLPLWHPNGAMLRFIIDKFETTEHLKRGYKLLTIPHIAKSDLFKISGHLDFYSENMYSPMEIDGQEYRLKPMNCPAHIKIFNSSIKSYRDLPFRAFEMGTVYRYERSGVLHGLTRVRGFTQDDAHIFCREDQIEHEITEVLKFTLEILDVFGFKDKNIYLSTRPEKSVGSDRNWEVATNALQVALQESGIPFKEDPGEGVFYGPKIDVKIKDAIGREWQCSTIQVDFNLPERFDINYIGKDGQKHRPIMIHRALLGSLERFIGILLEHYGGKFPVWLAPVLVILLSVSDEVSDYVTEKVNLLLQKGIRLESDIRDESISYKVRDAVSKKIPYICVIGKKEVEENTLTVRKLGDNKPQLYKFDEFVEKVENDVINQN